MPDRKPIMQPGCPRGQLKVYGDSGRWELNGRLVSQCIGMLDRCIYGVRNQPAFSS